MLADYALWVEDGGTVTLLSWDGGAWAVDTALDGEPRPFLCVPLKLRGKTVGLFRAFPEDRARASARTAEMIGAVLSAAVRSVLLYRSLLATIDDIAVARREAN